MASGQEMRRLRGHTASVRRLAISADGRRLVSVDADNEVKVWATDPAEEADLLFHKGIIVYVAVSPDGETLATSDSNFFTLRLWDLRTRTYETFLTNDKMQGKVRFRPMANG